MTFDVLLSQLERGEALMGKFIPRTCAIILMGYAAASGDCHFYSHAA